MAAPFRALAVSTIGRAIEIVYDRSCYLVNMSDQRKQRADGVRIREAIVCRAVSLATLHGLAGLSMGNLSSAL